MLEQYRSNSHLFGGNAPYVEEMYEAYLDNPGSVPDNWRAYFDALQHVPAVDGSASPDVPHAPVVESFAQRAKANAFAHKASEGDLSVARKQVLPTASSALVGPTSTRSSVVSAPVFLSSSPRSMT
jgi:2-oxoglutarate dehydrogenase E1 component